MLSNHEPQHAREPDPTGLRQEAPAVTPLLRLAYLTTEYPAGSHTFIRRELREIERRGHTVLRLAIRRSKAPLADPLDQEEAEKTLHCLAQPWWQLGMALLRAACTQPSKLARTLWIAVKMGLRSERGVARHLAYLVEACYFLRVLQQQRIQHVHVHFGTNAAAVARLVRRLGGPSYSFTVHGPDEFDAPRSFDIGGKAEDAAFVVAISDYCGAQLRRWIPPAHWPKIHVVHCTVGEEFFDAAQEVPESRTLVCVGRLCPQKGQLLLIDAMHELMRFGVDGRLVLAGDGEMRDVIEQRMRELEVQDRVTITGWISEAEVRRQILAARAMVLPSFAEGLPMTIMEAYALGRPVISTYVAAIPELVRPGATGWLVMPGCVDELANAMRESLDSSVGHLTQLASAGSATGEAPPSHARRDGASRNAAAALCPRSVLSEYSPSPRAAGIGRNCCGCAPRFRDAKWSS